jgi:hypothetical protein
MPELSTLWVNHATGDGPCPQAKKIKPTETVVKMEATEKQHKVVLPGPLLRHTADRLVIIMRQHLAIRFSALLNAPAIPLGPPRGKAADASATREQFLSDFDASPHR